MHVPHYTHMFESIMAGPRPWRFGHVYLPGGSASLGTLAAVIHSTSASGQSADSGAAANDTDDLEACGAPSVGSLMELVSALRCRDGRLLILAYSVGRIQVTFSSGSGPHLQRSMVYQRSTNVTASTVNPGSVYLGCIEALCCVKCAAASAVLGICAVGASLLIHTALQKFDVGVALGFRPGLNSSRSTLECPDDLHDPLRMQRALVAIPMDNMTIGSLPSCISVCYYGVIIIAYKPISSRICRGIFSFASCLGRSDRDHPPRMLFRGQVETVTQEVPYSKGRCRLLPDAEEMAAAESLASHVVEDAPLDATLVSAMAATISASKAAAAASAEVQYLCRPFGSAFCIPHQRLHVVQSCRNTNYDTVA